jgi:polyribonucleotide nucleotidyltransferase
VLSDILGDEDHLGDMDFKVAGTVNGITATQMDIKVDGLSYEVLSKALYQAKEGRLHILEKMLEVIPEPRADYKPNVPRIEVIEIPKDMIGAVIGPGGKIIQAIQEETKTVIVIEEVDNIGLVQISGSGVEAIEAAKKRIKAIVALPEVGEIYKGKVKSVVSFGAFVEVIPGKDGLLHVSEMDWNRVESAEDYIKEGDEIEVKLIGIDEKTGKLKLSRKVLLPKPEGYVERPPREDRVHAVTTAGMTAVTTVAVMTGALTEETTEEIFHAGKTVAMMTTGTADQDAIADYSKNNLRNKLFITGQLFFFNAIFEIKNSQWKIGQQI